MQKVAVSGWVTLAASTIALLLLRGPYVNGTGLGAIFDLGQVQSAVETKEGTALLSRLLGHQRVSRCRVWRPHQRQYLRNSTRSGEFRFDFCVW